MIVTELPEIVQTRTSSDHKSWTCTDDEQELGQGWLAREWLLAYTGAHREAPDFGACKAIVTAGQAEAADFVTPVAW